MDLHHPRDGEASTARNVKQGEDNIMKWKTPRIVEIAVGMEINCYACAEI
jgi:coenzyme PQQ precursor peptide PqqA